MRKSFLLLLFATIWSGLAAQDQVAFEFSSGIDGTLKTKMEQQLTNLLTAINRAESSGSNEINFKGIDFESNETASQTISMLWNCVHFRTQDDDFYQPCLAHRRAGRVTGYQVRNIYMDMKPVDDSYQESLVQEFVIELDAQGRISDVNIAMSKLQYQDLLRDGERLNDLDRREQIINYCEQFSNAYHRMDLQFMEDVFSDDALIITGRVRQRVPSNMMLRHDPETGRPLPKQSDVEYTVHTKQEYLNNLRRIFTNQRNKPGGFVNVEFSDYKITRSGAKPNFYGVTVKQRWNTKGYGDEGIVFLVWDFTNEERPKIQVRTWQEMSTEERKIFTLNDFKLR